MCACRASRTTAGCQHLRLMTDASASGRLNALLLAAAALRAADSARGGMCAEQQQRALWPMQCCRSYRGATLLTTGGRCLESFACRLRTCKGGAGRWRGRVCALCASTRHCGRLVCCSGGATACECLAACQQGCTPTCRCCAHATAAGVAAAASATAALPHAVTAAAAAAAAGQALMNGTAAYACAHLRVCALPVLPPGQLLVRRAARRLPCPSRALHVT
jgi:hypothetical protein